MTTELRPARRRWSVDPLTVGKSAARIAKQIVARASDSQTDDDVIARGPVETVLRRVGAPEYTGGSKCLSALEHRPIGNSNHPLPIRPRRGRGLMSNGPGERARRATKAACAPAPGACAFGFELEQPPRPVALDTAVSARGWQRAGGYQRADVRGARAAAARLDLDREHALETLCPPHRDMLRHEPLGTGGVPRAATAAGRRDRGAQRMMRGEDPVIPRLMLARRRTRCS